MNAEVEKLDEKAFHDLLVSRPERAASVLLLEKLNARSFFVPEEQHRREFLLLVVLPLVVVVLPPLVLLHPSFQDILLFLVQDQALEKQIWIWKERFRRRRLFVASGCRQDWVQVAPPTFPRRFRQDLKSEPKQAVSKHLLGLRVFHFLQLPALSLGVKEAFLLQGALWIWQEMSFEICHLMRTRI